MSPGVKGPAADPALLPDGVGVLKQMVAELLTTVTRLRTTIDQQQAHIQSLVRMTFGRRSERVEGPMLFDLAGPAAERPAPPPEPLVPATIVQRRGHGRRKRLTDLPREREV